MDVIYLGICGLATIEGVSNTDAKKQPNTKANLTPGGSPNSNTKKSGPRLGSHDTARP